MPGSGVPSAVVMCSLNRGGVVGQLVAGGTSPTFCDHAKCEAGLLAGLDECERKDHFHFLAVASAGDHELKCGCLARCDGGGEGIQFKEVLGAGWGRDQHSCRNILSLGALDGYVAVAVVVGVEV